VSGKKIENLTEKIILHDDDRLVVADSEDLDLQGDFITKNVKISNVRQKYINLTPMPETVGGAEAGSTFSGDSLQEVLDKILYPYQYPSFSSFSINFSNTNLEVGDSTQLNPSAMWETVNNVNITPNTINIINVTDGGNILENAYNDGGEVLSLAPISRISPGSHVFRITGKNTKGLIFQRDFVINWRWRLFYGESIDSILDESLIEKLRVSVLVNSFSGDYSFNYLSNGYKYICYPESFGEATIFLDTDTGFAVPFELLPGKVSITNTPGIATDYIVYRSVNILNGILNVNVS